jgi:hypothetical protein
MMTGWTKESKEMVMVWPLSVEINMSNGRVIYKKMHKVEHRMTKVR